MIKFILLVDQELLLKSLQHCAAITFFLILIVAGGGGGGGTDNGAAGGAGGYREVKSPSYSLYRFSPLDGYPNAPNRITVSAQAYPITVGGGGAAGTNSPQRNGVNGVNSTFWTITSTGGGGGRCT